MPAGCTNRDWTGLSNTNEIQQRLHSACNIYLAIATLSRLLTRYGLTQKHVQKVTLEHNEELRTLWEATILFIPPRIPAGMDRNPQEWPQNPQEWPGIRRNGPGIHRNRQEFAIKTLFLYNLISKLPYLNTQAIKFRAIYYIYY